MRALGWDFPSYFNNRPISNQPAGLDVQTRWVGWVGWMSSFCHLPRWGKMYVLCVSRAYFTIVACLCKESVVVAYAIPSRWCYVIAIWCLSDAMVQRTGKFLVVAGYVLCLYSNAKRECPSKLHIGKFWGKPCAVLKKSFSSEAQSPISLDVKVYKSLFVFFSLALASLSLRRLEFLSGEWVGFSFVLVARTFLWGLSLYFST